MGLLKTKPVEQSPPLEVLERQLPGGGMLLTLVTSTSHRCNPPLNKEVRKLGMRQGTVWECECGRAWRLTMIPNFWMNFLGWASGSDYCRLSTALYDSTDYRNS